jgi:plasmid stabilization system protein ParE
VAAKRAVKVIREGVKILVVHPQVGKVVEDMDAVFRDWPVDFGDSGYVVRYRFDGELATILAVRHQKEIGF